MAKHNRATALAPIRPIIVQAGPSRVPSRRRRAVAAVARGARRVGSLARRAASKPGVAPTALALGGAAFGFLDGAGHLDFIPAIGGSRALTMALGGFALTRFSKNKWARIAGTTALIAGAIDFGRKQGEQHHKTQGASGPASDGLDGDESEF